MNAQKNTVNSGDHTLDQSDDAAPSEGPICSVSLRREVVKQIQAENREVLKSVAAEELHLYSDERIVVDACSAALAAVLTPDTSEIDVLMPIDVVDRMEAESRYVVESDPRYMPSLGRLDHRSIADACHAALGAGRGQDQLADIEDGEQSDA